MFVLRRQSQSLRVECAGLVVGPVALIVDLLGIQQVTGSFVLK